MIELNVRVHIRKCIRMIKLDLLWIRWWRRRVHEGRLESVHGYRVCPVP